MPGYKPSFGGDTPRRRNLTIDVQRKPVSISAETMADIEQIRAVYRASTTENTGSSGGVKVEKSTGRNAFSFVRKAKPVDMDLSAAGIRSLTTKDRQKTQYASLRKVFKKMDSDGDERRAKGYVDCADLERELVRLGYVPEPGEVRDMIWEVDDDGDGKINWREFKSIYQRVRDDDLGKEPRRMYNVIEFMVFDIDNDGTIDLEEVMQLFYQRYGKEKLFKDANDAKATKQTAHDITFTEFVKHDEQFYTVSRQITDSKRAQEQAGEEELSPSEQLSARRPKPTRYQVRQQDPNRLRKRRHRTLADHDGGSDGGESAEWDDDGVDARVPRRDDPERQVQDEEYRGVIDTNADKTPFAAAVSALKVADKAAKEAADNDFEARWAAVRLYEEGVRLIDVAVEAKDEGDQDALNDMLIGALTTRKDKVMKRIEKLTPPVAPAYEAPLSFLKLATCALPVA